MFVGRHMSDSGFLVLNPNLAPPPRFFLSSSDEDVRMWLVSQLKALCSWKPPEGEDEARTVQQKIIMSKKLIQSPRLLSVESGNRQTQPESVQMTDKPREQSTHLDLCLKSDVM